MGDGWFRSKCDPLYRPNCAQTKSPDFKSPELFDGNRDEIK